MYKLSYVCIKFKDKLTVYGFATVRFIEYETSIHQTSNSSVSSKKNN